MDWINFNIILCGMLALWGSLKNVFSRARFLAPSRKKKFSEDLSKSHVALYGKHLQHITISLWIMSIIFITLYKFLFCKFLQAYRETWAKDTMMMMMMASSRLWLWNLREALLCPLSLWDKSYFWRGDFEKGIDFVVTPVKLWRLSISDQVELERGRCTSIFLKWEISCNLLEWFNVHPNFDCNYINKVIMSFILEQKTILAHHTHTLLSYVHHHNRKK